MKRNKILKKPKRTQSFISTVLMFALLLGIFPVIPISISADDPGGSVGVSSIEEAEPFTVPLLPGDLTAEELKEAVLSDADKTAVVSQADIDSLEHVNRLYLQEPDEYTVIFQNRDGGKTVYVFDRPVKTRNANGTYSDMTAAAIVSSTQGGTLDTMGNPQPAAQAISLKAMNEKLTAYKQSRNLNEYQMLDDVFITNNISSNGIITRVEPGILQIFPANSVSIMSLSVTYSTFNGYHAIKSTTSTTHLGYTEYGLTTTSNITETQSRWIFDYYGSGEYLIYPETLTEYCLAYVDGDTAYIDYKPMDEPEHEKIWTITAVSTGVYTIYNNGAYIMSNGQMGSTNTQWKIYNNFQVVSLEIVDKVVFGFVEDYIPVPEIDVFPYFANNADSFDCFSWEFKWSTGASDDGDGYIYTGYSEFNEIRCRHLETNVISDYVEFCISEQYNIVSGHTYRLSYGYNDALTYHAENGNYYNTIEDFVPQSWNNISQAFSFTRVGDAYRVASILTTNQYGSGTSFVNKYSTYNTLYSANESNVGYINANRGSTSVNSPNNSDDSQLWYICKFQFNEVMFFSLVNKATGAKLTAGENEFGEWFLSHLGTDIPLVKHTNSYNPAAPAVLQVLYSFGYYDYVVNYANALNVISNTLNSGYSESGMGANVSGYLNSKLSMVTYQYYANQNGTTPQIEVSFDYPYVCRRIINGKYHYETIVGYDAETQCFIVFASGNNGTNYGIRLIDSESYPTLGVHIGRSN